MYYGWILLGVAWILYGFGISPGYYSWGQFSPAIIDELGMSRAQTGFIFGLFNFMFSAVGPLTAGLLPKFGLRVVMTIGCLLAALGFFLVQQADSMWEFIVYFCIIAGAGVGFSTILPCQTLATNWFSKYRARAVAIIFIAGGIVGKGVTRFDAWILENHDWRDGWLWIAGVSLTLAVLAALFIRNSPEQQGLHPDGIDPSEADTQAPEAQTAPEPAWTAIQALKTPQFAALALAGIAYSVPWGVVIAHGALHLGDLGFETVVIAAIMGNMVLISTAGRLTGSLSDWVAPEKVLGVALLVEGAGVSLLVFARTTLMAYVSMIAIGLGFGAAYISIVLVFSKFFGRTAFAKTAGTRILITGFVGFWAPGLAGRVFDTTDSYTIAFVVITALAFAGAVTALLVKAPKPPQLAIAPQPATS